ncbi:uncharacterized protein LOC110974122 [Acanthaster planci]|uniref:Uncharacterized protein LOC110974122 n=1 Tax=Acanthaster planci TaxID=133434 RepID=A0A8B7XK53_ACAPL|nr:uncharacterized protein LOC110974122 [Acanthaster planci]
MSQLALVALLGVIGHALSAQGQEHIPLTLNVESGLQDVPCGGFRYFSVEVTDPCKDLRVMVTKIEGEPDVYIGRGNNMFPTDNTLAWSSYEWGSENLTVSSWDPEFEVGTFYIGVHAYCGIDVHTGNTSSKVKVLAESLATSHMHPEITAGSPIRDGRVDAQGYNYYRFCLPHKCANVEVKLENCLSGADCPDSYGYPELLVSRSIVRPSINDHSWKLATVTRRSVYLRHDDPDVKPGHYFVGVYGWCTPDENCPDKSTCGPCEYVANMAYSVSIIMTDVADCNPNPEKRNALSVEGQKHVPLTLNVESGLYEVPCGEFRYFSVEVTDPCKDLRVRIQAIQGEPDLYISRGNDKFPTDKSLTWTSYNWGSEDLTVSSWDPEFEVGPFYIGVHAYCGSDVGTGHTPSKFTILAESVPTSHPHDEITVNSPIRDGRVVAQGYNYYRFCLPQKCANVEVKLENCLSGADCPDSYGYPELLVSRSIVQPSINDHSWKLASIYRRSVYLRHDDPDVKPGHYYVGVYGWCTPDEHCPDKNSCGPCEYVPNMTYNVSLILTDVADCHPTAGNTATISMSSFVAVQFSGFVMNCSFSFSFGSNDNN